MHNPLTTIGEAAMLHAHESISALAEQVQRLARALETQPTRPVMTMEELAEHLRLSIETVSRKVICREDFPRPCQVTEDIRGRRWRLSDVETWLASRRDRLPRPRRRRAS